MMKETFIVAPKCHDKESHQGMSSQKCPRKDRYIYQEPFETTYVAHRVIPYAYGQSAGNNDNVLLHTGTHASLNTCSI